MEITPRDRRGRLLREDARKRRRGTVHPAQRDRVLSRSAQLPGTFLGPRIEPLTDEEFAQIKATRDSRKTQLGDPYGEEYGWAAATLGIKKPNFSDIERNAGLAHLRPYYKLASNNVHANPKGTFFKLGLLPDQQILLAGPSDLGLADPGQATAISLSQITSALLTMKPNIDRLVICHIMLKLGDEVGNAFISAHRAHERGEPD